MNTQTDSITVAARDLAVGDQINGTIVTDVDTATTPGLVYVRTDLLGHHPPRADMIFHHGDPVRIERPDRAEACLTCGQQLTGDDPVVTTLGPRCAKHF